MLKRSIYIISLILLSLQLPTNLYSQIITIISGTAVDSLTNEQMPYMSVYFRVTTSGAVPEEVGQYYIMITAPVT